MQQPTREQAGSEGDCTKQERRLGLEANIYSVNNSINRRRGSIYREDTYNITLFNIQHSGSIEISLWLLKGFQNMTLL